MSCTYMFGVVTTFLSCVGLSGRLFYFYVLNYVSQRVIALNIIYYCPLFTNVLHLYIFVTFLVKRLDLCESIWMKNVDPICIPVRST
jgi:hypothetical protein